MGSFAPENIIASQKASVDTTFGLAAQAVQGFEKLVDLNVRTLRTALDEQQALFARASSLRDPQEFFALQNQHLQDLAQRTQAYWINVYEIAAGVRGGWWLSGSGAGSARQVAAQCAGIRRKPGEQCARGQRSRRERVEIRDRRRDGIGQLGVRSGEEGRAAGCRSRVERRERREPGGRARGSAENGQREEVILRGGCGKDGGFVRLFLFPAQPPSFFSASS